MALVLPRRVSAQPTPWLRLPAGLIRGLITITGLIAAWQVLVIVSGVPPFILPPPGAVALALVEDGPRLVTHTLTTLMQILAGLGIGTVLGGLTGLALASSKVARRWLHPLLIMSQALPVFALAPLLVLWLGYGPASKIAMAVLIIYFPMTATLYDGLRRTDPGLLDLARLAGANALQVLVLIRLPSALPAFTSGLRVAAAVAPIGAVVGEWVGASQGLGYAMLQANARMQVDTMFAALLILTVLTLTLYTLVDRFGRRLVPWAETN